MAEGLEAHVAEYAALTSRLTNWITLQYLTYGFAATALAVFLKPKLELIESWAFLLVLLLLAWAILQTVDEIVSTAIYIEQELGVEIEKLFPKVSPGKLWAWELFLRKRRGPGKGFKQWFIHFERTSGLFVPFACGILAAILKVGWGISHPWPAGWRAWIESVFWFVVSAYVLAAVIVKSRYIIDSHKELDELTSKRASAAKTVTAEAKSP